jgi:hypothetical protein
MKGKTKEHWMELCEQAAVEQDHERLMKLVNEIDRMLEEKDERLTREQPKGRAFERGRQEG